MTPELAQISGLRGVVVPISSENLVSGQLNGSLMTVHSMGLELYCRFTTDQIGALSSDELWNQLQRVQHQLPFARIVLPALPQSFVQMTRAALYGWKWQMEGVKSLAQAAQALEAGCAGIWIQVGALDGAHELDGDELCSQVRNLVDSHAGAPAQPLVVATDIRDLDHVERSLQYGCDRTVVTQQLWQQLNLNALAS